MGLTAKEEFDRQVEELERDLDLKKEGDGLPTANIVVAGITGTGKSTLINAVFGSELAKTGTGLPQTDRIEEHKGQDMPICIWDTVGLELDSKKTEESIKEIKKTIASKSSINNPYDRIHAIWYCVNSGSRRYQGAELNFIKELYSVGVPFIIVLTQCCGDESEVNNFEKEIKRINESMNMGNIEIVQVLAQPVKFRGLPMPIPAFGLEELVNTTLKLLPDFIKSGFVAAQRVSQVEKRAVCEEIIYKYVKKAEIGFWDRVPLVNVFMTDQKIMKMIQDLGLTYNTVLSEESIKKLINQCNVDFDNNFWGLISPISMKYSRNITTLLEQKKEEGYSVKVADVEKNKRAARMIAFYGYTFVDSVEQLWKESTQEQLKNIDYVIRNLVGIINDKLKENKAKVRR